MKNNKADNLNFARYKVLLVVFGLIVIIMSFTGFVNYISFANNYNESLAKTYAVAGNEKVREIEYALKYGKPIDNFFGMHETLEELTEVIADVDDIKIVTPNGAILYDLEGFVIDKHIPDELINAAVFNEGLVDENLSYKIFQNQTYVFIEINDYNSHHVASLVMVFPQDIFLQLDSPLTMQLVTYLILIAVIVLGLLSIIFLKTRLVHKDNTINKKRFLIVFIAIMGIAQMLYSSVNYHVYHNAYNDMAYTSKEFIVSTIDNNIENIYSSGLSLDNIEGFESYIESIKTSLPQIDEIGLVTKGESELQLTSANKVDVLVSYDYIDQQMFRILLDMITVLIISVFFMVELTLLAFIIFLRKPDKNLNLQSNGAVATSHGLVRGLTFFINLCAFMSLTFIAIVMNNLYQPILGLSKDVVLGLPLSAEMLGGIIAIILAGWSISKQGWRTILYIGGMFLLLGNLLSGFSNDAITYIVSRAIAGFGLGYILMSLRSLVVSLPKTNIAIAEFAAGAIAGLNCGVVIGGMLADRIGYDATFYLAAILAIIPILFVRRLMGEYEIEQRETSDISALAKFINFIADKKAIVFLACIFIPFFISGAFLDYFFPLFAASHDLTQSDISRGFLLHGLFIIYLGPLLTKYATNKLGNKNGIIFSMFIVVSALATFMAFGTIAAAFVTLALLGIAESFGMAMKTSYFLNLKGIKDLEINQGMAYFSFMVNLGRMLGPIMFGIALSLGIKMGIGIIALFIFLLLLVFIFSNRQMPIHSNKSLS
ncbi:hypothetical protein SYNTR_1265 [Candidatus Syntrophocurvum alkaliphilum]|uniref:Major facilitator superfamily (MFS) profile domain-containing protein n=1 Tax=Candidatus Syntrophocurvum alkaliphilum TaxID=2293317 RepID=A0A6I6DAP2_9FIRM|nr:MFS transporter [Candidatus Syntrophocurvum alkaliphilum]QGT99858.1 hypothetical protein SYNTR_1265 [Candidatus Syntrophocurvum alkaliphilum]